MSYGWREIATAPKDGTLVLLLVAAAEHPLEDATIARTIGSNSLDHDGEDVWRFAGWCWCHDHHTDGVGVPVAWQPLPGIPPELGR